jgi:hypothetical protein
MQKDTICRFLNDCGQIIQWPTKDADKLLAVAYLASKFDPNKEYSELEVNDLLKRWHTFSDWPLLRRSLVDYGYLDRQTNGSSYKPTNKINEAA